MFIRYSFFSLLLISSANYAMDKYAIVAARERLEEVFNTIADDTASEAIVEVALQLAKATGFRSDEYKNGRSSNGKLVRIKKLAKQDRQKQSCTLPGLESWQKSFPKSEEKE